MTAAHLNGGPLDDQIVAVPWPVLRVGGFHWQPPSALVYRELTPEEISVRSGLYQPQLDGNGSRVPHNLAGVEEWDWQGWSG